MTTVGLDPMKMSRLPGKSGEKADKLRGRVIFDLLTAYKKIHTVEGRKYPTGLTRLPNHNLGKESQIRRESFEFKDNRS